MKKKMTKYCVHITGSDAGEIMQPVKKWKEKCRVNGE